MPTYEMPILLRVMKKSQTAEVLKRVANGIFGTGGFIRKIENWGEKQLPVKTSSHGQVHREASHFMFCFDVPPVSLKELQDEYLRDIDIIRVRIYKQNLPTTQRECTLEEELLPPPFRPSVLNIIKQAEKQKLRRDKSKFKYNSGLDYYPFLK
ncbi:mitochondrial ribosomal protein S6 [Calliopsis andreniformis]|uniref:mitochondrial ribosomal protein S6 n=1 Tax=Calliopsis andreniformis TaxID=337506 RepID=UPI003FCD2407